MSLHNQETQSLCMWHRNHSTAADYFASLYCSHTWTHDKKRWEIYTDVYRVCTSKYIKHQHITNWNTFSLIKILFGLSFHDFCNSFAVVFHIFLSCTFGWYYYSFPFSVHAIYNEREYDKPRSMVGRIRKEHNSWRILNILSFHNHSFHNIKSSLCWE